MNIPQALAQQDSAVRAIVACVPRGWLRIVVNYECLEGEGDQMVDSTLSLYVKKGRQKMEAETLRLPHEVTQELLILRGLVPARDGEKWSTCELIIERTGEYRFNFSYGVPKRLNGIFDEESYDRFRNYADKYSQETGNG
jgi:hypothetical protein